MTSCSTANQNSPTTITDPTIETTVTVLVSPTVIPATATPESMFAPTPTSSIPASPPARTEQASFVSENYPDNSMLKPGEEFDKTFELKNVGSATWTTSYSLVLYSSPQDDTLGSPSQIILPEETPPGQTVSILIPLVAPATPGTYAVYWSLKNERGETVPVDGGDSVWVKIMVCDPDQPCNPAATGGGTGGATTSGITATLTEFTHDAQGATVKFCMTMPNRYYALRTPVPSLLVDQEPAPFLDGGTIQPWGCYFMKYQVSAAQIEQAQHILLSIDAALSMSPPPGAPNDACQAAKPGLIAKYPGLDFQCNYSGAGYYTDLRLPDGMTREEAQQIIFDTIEGAIYGPWVLTIK